MVTKYSTAHGVESLAKDLVANYMMQPAAQLTLALANDRSPANLKALAQVKDKDLKAFGAASSGGVPDAEHPADGERLAGPRRSVGALDEGRGLDPGAEVVHRRSEEHRPEDRLSSCADRRSARADLRSRETQKTAAAQPHRSYRTTSIRHGDERPHGIRARRVPKPVAPRTGHRLLLRHGRARDQARPARRCNALALWAIAHPPRRRQVAGGARHRRGGARSSTPSTSSRTGASCRSSILVPGTVFLVAFVVDPDRLERQHRLHQLVDRHNLTKDEAIVAIEERSLVAPADGATYAADAGDAATASSCSCSWTTPRASSSSGRGRSRAARPREPRRSRTARSSRPRATRSSRGTTSSRSTPRSTRS